MVRWRTWVTVIAVGLVAALSGCSGGGSDGDEAGGGEAPATMSVPAAPGGSSTTLDPRSGEAVATLRVPVDVERPDDAVTFDVQSLTVEGPTMVLRFSITPDFASEDDSTAISLFDVYTSQAPGAFIQLVDRVNLKEYSVIQDRPTFWMSDSTDVESLNGEPMYVFAVFAAPEDDIDVVDVTFRDNWLTLVDLPIER